ncbi:histidine phosphatase family protein [Thermopirellula anaerolimosa]
MSSSVLPTTVVLIRPGASRYETEGRIRGTLDIPLDQNGLEETARLIRELEAAELRLEALYHGPCRPAIETAEAVGRALGVPVRRVPNLRNLNYGLWQGMLIEEIRTRQPKIYRQWQELPECVCPPEGETIAEAEERLTRELQKILRRHRGETVGLVVAEPIAAVIKRILTQCPLGDLWKAESGHGRMECIRVGTLEPAPASN